MLRIDIDAEVRVSGVGVCVTFGVMVRLVCIVMPSAVPMAIGCRAVCLTFLAAVEITGVLV